MKNLLRNISPFNGRDQMPLWQYIIKMLLLFLGGFLIQGAMEEALCRGLVLHGL